MYLTQLETPALVVDEKIFEENLLAMEKLLDGKTLKLRPHFKSNKCAAIAHKQIEHKAIGITCAKLSEAEDLIDSGIEDVLIANQIVETQKIAKLAYLAKKCHLTVCVDDLENAKNLSKAALFADSTIYCYVEYDIGMRRCGIVKEEDFVKLALEIEKLPNLKFSGIQAYAGHVSHMQTQKERSDYTEKYKKRLTSLVKALEKEGLKATAISGGSTGTAVLKAEDGLYTELQAGSYIFLDATYNQLENLPFKNSLYVLATVISRQEGTTILDAGVKAMGMDQGDPILLTLDGKIIEGEMSVNEEHLKLYDASENLSLGDKVLVIPGHCCSTINLYEKLYFFKDGKIVARQQISARGFSR